jgi:hypothetical protein
MRTRSCVDECTPEVLPLVVQAADVVCVTCAGAGDPRLSAFRFRKVKKTSLAAP